MTNFGSVLTRDGRFVSLDDVAAGGEGGGGLPDWWTVDDDAKTVSLAGTVEIRPDEDATDQPFRVFTAAGARALEVDGLGGVILSGSDGGAATLQLGGAVGQTNPIIEAYDADFNELILQLSAQGALSILPGGQVTDTPALLYVKAHADAIAADALAQFYDSTESYGLQVLAGGQTMVAAASAGDGLDALKVLVTDQFVTALKVTGKGAVEIAPAADVKTLKLTGVDEQTEDVLLIQAGTDITDAEPWMIRVLDSDSNRPFALDAHGNLVNRLTDGAHFRVVAADAAMIVEGRNVGDVPMIGFLGADSVPRPTGVAVDAAGIHAALVTLGLIAA